VDSPLAQLTIPAVWAPLGALGAAALVLAGGWMFEQRQAARRGVLRRLYRLGEQLLACRSSPEAVRLLQTELPGLLGADDVRLYLVDRQTGSLVWLDASAAAPALAEERVRFRLRNAEICFRNHTPLAVPDTRQSPLFETEQAAETPRSMLFIPMSAIDELSGVLSVGYSRRTRAFDQDERAVLQHLANQIAIAMRVREQRSLRASAAGSERLEAQSRLVLAAAAEIAPRLEEAASGADPAAPAALALASLGRLKRFASLHRERAEPVELGAALRSTAGQMLPRWRAQGITVRDATGEEPLAVFAPPGVLPLVLASLLRQAEARFPALGGKPFTLRALRLASTAQVDLTWPGPAGEPAGGDPLNESEVPAPDVFSLGVCRALVASLGGQLRVAADGEGGRRLEIVLPLAQAGVEDLSELPRSRPGPSRSLTALILEAHPPTCQALAAALGELGHRGIPAASAEEALDLVRRLRIDVFFCGAAAAGASWQDCYQETRGRIGLFVLLTHGDDPSAAAALAGADAATLAVPLHPAEVARLMEAAALRTAGL
jgi:GAF domain-containing protein